MKIPSFVNDHTLPVIEYHHGVRQWLREMRDTCPIIWDEENTSWLLFRYADITQVQSDYHTFASEPPGGRGGSLFEQDPPLHRQMRSLVTQAFSPKMIASMAPQIEQIVDELLEEVKTRGTFDW